MYYVYVIVSNKSETYIGYTNDINRRIKEHNNNRNESTKNRTWKLAYCEAYRSEKEARIREQKLKQRGSAKHHLFNRIIESISMCKDVKKT